MLKWFAILTLASTVIAIPALAKENPSVMVQAMKGATTCTLSAGKDAVDTVKFDSDPSWLKLSDGGYAATDLSVMISFPKGDDGIARICVVEATLGSQEEQKEMQLALEVLLKQKPIEQDDSVIWMFGAPPNVRGLQFFPDTTSDKPEIRFIGAAF